MTALGGVAVLALITATVVSFFWLSSMKRAAVYVGSPRAEVWLKSGSSRLIFTCIEMLPSAVTYVSRLPFTIAV